MASVVLTGASSGIGLQCALLLLEKGYKLYAISRKVSTLEALQHPNCVRLDCDLSDEAQVKQVVGKILAQDSQISALINNAGYGLLGSLEEHSLEQAKALFQVNLFSIAQLTSLLLPTLRQNTHLSPKIINVASSAGRSTTLFLGWYHASKYALEAYSDCLRAELIPFGVQVVLIEPGAIETKWDQGTLNAYIPDPKSPYDVECQKASAFYKQTYQRATKPQVIAACILQALQAPRPKTRYLVGKHAHLLVWAKKCLPDRLYDWVVRQKILG
ncbi:SDR family NAD(P)-dependent oxidoreductase [Helicobacter bizzozeronii]|uniref:SDR family NAD(P)-dependent oxidoreductase n=1 Tax=Helicobacter bizzozeronii TaxID=56877 RepID=UPI000CF14EA4|nr:SDR family NAD(P)-dependent oxidoreductase [Helicobacter bizzozeronii]